ncbi:MAG: hypothetical protein P8Y81_07545, partial [Ignavibacteriaceae bacterium]
MSSYKYSCIKCGTKYFSEIIEKEFHYLCPKCGKAENNKPLVGVLEIIYDYDKIKKKISKENFL